MSETVRLHRCPFTFIHSNFDSCWKVQTALDEQGIEYENGSAYRAESEEMAAEIRAGRLFEHAAG
jgi:hypothetical protein